MATTDQSIRTARVPRQADDGVTVAPERHGRDGRGGGAGVDERDVAGRGAGGEEVQVWEGGEGEERVRGGAGVDEGRRREVPGAQGVVPRGRVGDGGVVWGEDGGGHGRGVGFEESEGPALRGGGRGG